MIIDDALITAVGYTAQLWDEDEDSDVDDDSDDAGSSSSSDDDGPWNPSPACPLLCI